MSVRLVNYVPGSLAEPMHPAKPIHLGLKSETGAVELGSLRVTMGYSSVAHRGVLPQEDTELERLGATVALATTERRNPVVGQVAASIAGSRLRIEKTDDTANNASVYEITMPVQGRQPALGFFRFRVQPWALFSPDWCDLSNMTGMYFGLEHGAFNSAVFAFLRRAAGGSVVVGGPLQTFFNARPGQQELVAEGSDWSMLPADGVIELWLYFNTLGYPPPYAAPYVPVVEVWMRRVGIDPKPMSLAILPAGVFGNFPSPGNANYRTGATDTVRLFFGNAGKTGDVLLLDDWVLYPDFRVVVHQGVTMPGSIRHALPDAPVVYQAKKGLRPYDVAPGRWFPLSGATAVRPRDFLRYVSQQPTTPRHLVVSKELIPASGFEKREPRLEAIAPVSSPDGVMLEAFISGNPERVVGELFGGVLAIDDGEKLFQLGFLESTVRRTVGLLKNPADRHLISTGYYTPAVDVDFRSMKLLRIVVDRRRSKVALYVDEELVVDQSLSDPWPVSLAGFGRITFGFLEDVDTSGRLNVTSLTYLPRYLAYEPSTDGLPNAAPASFDEVTEIDPGGSAVISDGRLTIKKDAFGVTDSCRAYRRLHDFYDTGGFLLDFKVKVKNFTDGVGAQFAPVSAVGAGITVRMGNKHMRFGFFNCGAHGKKIGIVPGSGSVEDILSQTALGRRFSASVNWEEETLYRVVYRAFDRIEVWATAVTNEPIISIPWQDDTQAFDLPDDTDPPSLEFGHYNEQTSSEVDWSYLRWGSSNGYEVSARPDFKTLPSYLFGGRVFVLASFDE